MAGSQAIARCDTQTARIVLAYPRREKALAHEIASQEGLACKVADLLGLEFIAPNDLATLHHSARPYYVPCDTLVDTGTVTEGRLPGVNGPHDLFGGVVRHAFIATKAITHSLFDLDAQRPTGWSTDFGERVRAVVLRGTTVFNADDARRAGIALLREGPIRAKPVNGIGGRGQRLLEDHAALDSVIEEYATAALADCGLVLEEHLEDVHTYSVGRVCVGELVSTYVGTQSLTLDYSGTLVYGGSDLRLIRGDFDALLTLDLLDAEREAVRLARVYDQAALSCYPGFYASRRNYDVAQGKDARGTQRFGVLEQSWRAGGASMAEAYALEAFQKQPELRSVRAFTCERYGQAPALPSAAHLVYCGEDTEIGLITKCAGISSYDDE